MVYGAIGQVGVNLSFEVQLVVLEFEGCSVKDEVRFIFIHDFKKSFFVLHGVSAISPGSESHKLVIVYAILINHLRGQRSKVEHKTFDMDFSSVLGVAAVDWLQINRGVFVPPESTKHAFHVSPSGFHMELGVAALREPENVSNAWAGASGVESLVLAFEEMCH